MMLWNCAVGLLSWRRRLTKNRSASANMITSSTLTMLLDRFHVSCWFGHQWKQDMIGSPVLPRIHPRHLGLQYAIPNLKTGKWTQCVVLFLNNGEQKNEVLPSCLGEEQLHQEPPPSSLKICFRREHKVHLTKESSFESSFLFKSVTIVKITPTLEVEKGA